MNTRDKLHDVEFRRFPAFNAMTLSNFRQTVVSAPGHERYVFDNATMLQLLDLAIEGFQARAVSTRMRRCSDVHVGGELSEEFKQATTEVHDEY